MSHRDRRRVVTTIVVAGLVGIAYVIFQAANDPDRGPREARRSSPEGAKSSRNRGTVLIVGSGAIFPEDTSVWSVWPWLPVCRTVEGLCAPSPAPSDAERPRTREEIGDSIGKSREELFIRCLWPPGDTGTLREETTAALEWLATTSDGRVRGAVLEPKNAPAFP